MQFSPKTKKLISAGNDWKSSSVTLSPCARGILIQTLNYATLVQFFITIVYLNLVTCPTHVSPDTLCALPL